MSENPPIVCPLCHEVHPSEQLCFPAGKVIDVNEPFGKVIDFNQPLLEKKKQEDEIKKSSKEPVFGPSSLVGPSSLDSRVLKPDSVKLKDELTTVSDISQGEKISKRKNEEKEKRKQIINSLLRLMGNFKVFSAEQKHYETSLPVKFWEWWRKESLYIQEQLNKLCEFESIMGIPSKIFLRQWAKNVKSRMSVGLSEDESTIRLKLDELVVQFNKVLTRGRLAREVTDGIIILQLKVDRLYSDIEKLKQELQKSYGNPRKRLAELEGEVQVLVDSEQAHEALTEYKDDSLKDWIAEMIGKEFDS